MSNIRHKDLIGLRFGKLKVLSLTERSGKHNVLTWTCICDCGVVKSVKGNTLRSGDAKSCGCSRVETKKDKIKNSKCLVCNIEFSHPLGTHTKCCSDICNNNYLAEWHKQYRNSNIQNRMGILVTRTKYKCEKLNLPFDISKEYLLSLLESQKGCCSKTGIKFEMRPAAGLGSSAPWGPSLDQIDPGKGYTKNNIQLVCLMYNQCKNTWTGLEVINFAKSLLETTIKNKELII